MSAAQAALVGLAAALATAAETAAVSLDVEGAPQPTPAPDGAPTPAIRLRPVSLTRLGRSTRDGALLDLELLTLVTVAGAGGLDAAERLIVGLERDSRYAVEPAPREDAPPGTLAFGVRVRVPVRIPEVSGPPVLEPLRLDLRTARLLEGVVRDAQGRPVPDAVVRAVVGGRPVVADAEGRFRLLAGDEDVTDVDVEVRGETRTVQATTSTAPVVIRWE